MRAKLINEAIKHLSGREFDLTPKFDYKIIERKLNALKKLGYIVLKRERPENQYSGKSIYWTIGTIDGKGHTGIGYVFPKLFQDKRGQYEPKSDYFYHNSCSGNILKPNDAPGSIWNNHSEYPGPGGWYTFNDEYILNVIERLKKAET